MPGMGIVPNSHLFGWQHNFMLQDQGGQWDHPLIASIILVTFSVHLQEPRRCIQHIIYSSSQNNHVRQEVLPPLHS